MMNYIIFDVEINGRLFKSDDPMEVIEIGAIKLNSSLEIIEEFSSLVKPVFKLSKFIRKFTGITKEEISDASSYPIVLESFKEWAGKDFLFVMWGSDDVKLLIQDCKYHNIDYGFLLNPYLDLINEYSRINNRINMASLTDAVIESGLDWIGQEHRALPDSKNTANLFLKYFDRLNFDNKSIYEDCSIGKKAVYSMIRSMVHSGVPLEWDEFIELRKVKISLEETRSDKDIWLLNLEKRFIFQKNKYLDRLKREEEALLLEPKIESEVSIQ